jgi:lysine 2,3-aminomutase
MWHDALRNRISTPEELAAALHLSDRMKNSMRRAAERFPIAIPLYYLNLIDPLNPKDPIRRQIAPSPNEMFILPGESADPLRETSFQPEPGLVHKYRNRALIQVTSQCAVHCRFCFRKHAPASTGNLSESRLKSIIAYIEKRKFIREIILSGGDPLMLDDAELANIIQRLQAIRSLEILRIHTRMPVVLPERITDALIYALKGKLTCWIVTHFNHPREINRESISATAKFVDAGIPMLNQTVLLRGVNDHLKILADLCNSLVRIRIKPYYMHVLDPAPGTSHFRISENDAILIAAGLSSKVSGYAAPLLAKDIPGLPGKKILFPDCSRLEGRL